MPQDPVVWIVAIVAGAIVVLVALWWGDVVEVGVKPPRLRFKRRGQRNGKVGSVDVGTRLHVSDSEIEEIIGVESEGGQGEAAAQDKISVAKNARITGGARVEKITGKRVSKGAHGEGGER